VCIDCTLASVSWDLSLRLWDLTSESAASTHVIENAHDDYMLSVAYSPEMQQIASASADQGVKLWDFNVDTYPGTPDSMSGDLMDKFVYAAAGELTEAKLPTVPDGRLGKRCCGVLLGHTADVSHVKWNSPKRLWVTGSEDHTVRLWSPEGNDLHTIRPPGDAITALAVDQKLGYILVASMDRAMRVYSPTTHQEMVQQHTGHSDAVRCIIHVPEKKQYLTASWDRTIRVWKAYTLRDGDISDMGGAETVEKTGAATARETDGEEEGEEEQEEERTLTYAELHPLREPKWLSDRDKRGAADKFLKKAVNEESKERRKKKQAEDDAAKSVTGLSLKLSELESTLRNTLERSEKPPSKEERRVQRGVGRGAGGRATSKGSTNTSLSSRR